MRFSSVDTDDAKPELTAADRRRARGFRIAGIILLVAGLATAGIIWWQGTRAAGADDSGFDENSKTQVRQVQTMFGQQGLVLQDLSDDLKQPGTQVCLILIVTGFLAAGCFYVAHLSTDDEE